MPDASTGAPGPALDCGMLTGVSVLRPALSPFPTTAADDAARRHPADTVFQQATTLYAQGAIGQAAMLLEHLPDRSPEHSVLYGLCQWHLGETRSALEAFHAAPHWQAAVHAVRGEWKAASRINTARSVPGSADHGLKTTVHGLLQQQGRRVKQAARTLEEAWTLPRQTAEHGALLLHTSVINHLSGGRLDAAARYVHLSEQQERQTPLLRRTQDLCAALIRQHEGDLESARHLQLLLRRAVAKGDHFLVLLFGGTQLETYGHQQQRSEAEQLELALKEYPGMAVSSGIAQFWLGNPHAAIRWLEHAQERPDLEHRRHHYLALIRKQDVSSADRATEAGLFAQKLSDKLNDESLVSVELLGECPRISHRNHTLNFGVHTLNAAKILRLLSLPQLQTSPPKPYSTQELVEQLIPIKPSKNSAEHTRKARVYIGNVIHKLRALIGPDLIVSEDNRYSLNPTYHITYDTDTLSEALRRRDVVSAAELLSRGLLTEETEQTELHQWAERLYRTFFKTVDEYLQLPLNPQDLHRLALNLTPFLEWPEHNPVISRMASHTFELLQQKISMNGSFHPRTPPSESDLRLPDDR